MTESKQSRKPPADKENWPPIIKEIEKLPLDKKGIEIFVKLGLRGNKEVEHLCSVQWKRPRNVPERDEDELRLWRFLADNGHAGAMFNVAQVYNEGLCGQKRDAKLAEEMYRKASQSGEPEGLLGHANFLRDKKDHKGAFPLYMKAAAAGDHRGHRAVAICYLRGQGVTADAEKGTFWMLKAAAMGSVTAQRDAGNLLRLGTGCDADPAAGAALLRKAMKAGDEEAKADFASLLLFGKGVEKDEALAVELMKEASDAGVASAQFHMASFYHAGQLVELDDEQAFELWTLSAKQGFTFAMQQLGMCYEKGFGCAKNSKKAASWYRKAQADPYVCKTIDRLEKQYADLGSQEP